MCQRHYGQPSAHPHVNPSDLQLASSLGWRRETQSHPKLPLFSHTTVLRASVQRNRLSVNRIGEGRRRAAMLRPSSNASNTGASAV